MYLIDTNVFLEVLLLRSRKDDCEYFLRLVHEGKKKAIVTDFSIHTILVIMGGLKRWRELKLFLSTLPTYRGLEIYTTSLADELKAADVGAKMKLDVEDAIQYSAAMAVGAEGIVSFDKHFDGLKIPRLEPRSVE